MENKVPWDLFEFDEYWISQKLRENEELCSKRIVFQIKQTISNETNNQWLKRIVKMRFLGYLKQRWVKEWERGRYVYIHTPFKKIIHYPYLYRIWSMHNFLIKIKMSLNKIYNSKFIYQNAPISHQTSLTRITER